MPFRDLPKIYFMPQRQLNLIVNSDWATSSLLQIKYFSKMKKHANPDVSLISENIDESRKEKKLRVN